jgi:sigma-B regulation protein RsbU (phosphoserine phosphatase)
MTRTSGQVELVPHNPGQLLGVLDDPILDEQTVALPPGSTLMLYTDGVLDARDENGNPFGKEQLMATLPKMMGVPAQEACNRLWSEIKEFQGSAPQDDDVTLVAIHDGQ